MEEKRDITIKDLAKELKLSTATVSRGLGDFSKIKPKTKKRIMDLAHERGYQINNFAKSLRQNKTFTIGVIVHELNTSFMVSVLAGIESILGGTEYDLLIAHSAEQGQKEIVNANNLFHKRVDGLIVSLAFDTPDLKHFDQFLNKKIPVVFFDRVEEITGGGVNVIIDNFKSGYQATKHLLDQGCKRIAHLTGNLSRNVYQRRFEGYKTALAKNNIPYDESLLFVSKLNKEDSTAVAQKIIAMENRPDALFAAGDLAATVCIQNFKATGLKVPEDIAVVGFNNDLISTVIEPNLTTINYSGFRMGETVANLLLDHFSGKADISFTDTIIMNSELVVRASSLKKK